jgi:hypothetical protein
MSEGFGAWSWLESKYSTLLIRRFLHSQSSDSKVKRQRLQEIASLISTVPNTSIKTTINHVGLLYSNKSGENIRRLGATKSHYKDQQLGLRHRTFTFLPPTTQNQKSHSPFIHHSSPPLLTPSSFPPPATP